MPKVLAIHDLSGFGRCSLSVILPILSCMGIQVCPIPTAILSTHTGNLGDFQFRDLTDYISPAFEHYKRLNLSFECIYTGFLGSVSQIDLCLDIFNHSSGSFKVVDPVMGDNGKLYKVFDNNMKNRMVELAREADLITPNLTEACILLNIEYPIKAISSSDARSFLLKLSEAYSRYVIITGVNLSDGNIVNIGFDRDSNSFWRVNCDDARSFLLKLSEAYSRYVIITGVNLSDGNIVNIGFDRDSNSFWRVNCDYVPISYPGTGDMYASIVVGSILDGNSFPIAMAKATRFLERAIKITYNYGSDPRYGVMFEKCLGWLTENNYIKDYFNL